MVKVYDISYSTKRIAVKFPPSGGVLLDARKGREGFYTLDRQAAKPLATLPKEGIALARCFYE